MNAEQLSDIAFELIRISTLLKENKEELKEIKELLKEMTIERAKDHSTEDKK